MFQSVFFANGKNYLNFFETSRGIFPDPIIDKKIRRETKTFSCCKKNKSFELKKVTLQNRLLKKVLLSDKQTNVWETGSFYLKEEFPQANFFFTSSVI